jgi:hypothetical protein
MSVVGGFPGLLASRRRTTRAPVNPMDKSTVVSIYPRPIEQKHYTITPGNYKIEAGSYEKPSILNVGPASWWREMDEEQPLLEITNSSVQIADSIIRDFCIGLTEVRLPNVMPGIFWVPGEYKVSEIRDKFASQLVKAKVIQDAYYNALVRLADGLWARTGGNPLTISDDMRLAADQLGIRDKDWMKEFTLLSKTSCPACGSPRNPEFPVCPTCKAIVDPDKATKMGIRFAQ